MARPKGSKAKHARDKSLSLVRLTAGEKNQITKNAGAANLTIAAFVRARILPEVSGSEVLTDPIPGGRLTVKRSALTAALQRIAVNLAQLDSFVEDSSDHALQEDFGELRSKLRSFTSGHLESGPTVIQSRSGWTNELNDLGQRLNRLTRGANVSGHIRNTDTLTHIVQTVGGVIDAMSEGEGAPKS